MPTRLDVGLWCAGDPPPRVGNRLEPLIDGAHALDRLDDRWLTIGSANLNEHSFFNDTEACLTTCDPELVRETRLRLWREHLGHEDPTFPTWRTRAEDDAYDRLRLLPDVSRCVRRFLGPVNGLLVDG